jgi:hypothetical protein
VKEVALAVDGVVVVDVVMVDTDVVLDVVVVDAAEEEE